MASRRRPRRPIAKGGALGLAKQLALAPITRGDLGAGPHLVEPAWDGHRVLATRVGAEVRLASSDHRDWSKTFPSVARALGKLPVASLGLDGVVCALDDRGTPSFERLRDLVADVEVALSPGAHTLRTLRARLDGSGDLAAPLLVGTGVRARALAQLRAQ